MENIDQVKVYKMNDYSWFVSKWGIKETNDFYSREYDDNDIGDIEECDLDTEGMWLETTDENDIKRLGDADELFANVGEDTIGDLWRRGNEVYKIVPFREVIAGIKDFTEPYEIATTEW